MDLSGVTVVLPALDEADLRVVEVPVRYRPRAAGASKVSGSPRGSLRAAVAMVAGTRWP
jgi:hypothetical protein